MASSSTKRSKQGGIIKETGNIKFNIKDIRGNDVPAILNVRQIINPNETIYETSYRVSNGKDTSYISKEHKNLKEAIKYIRNIKI